MAVKPEYFRWKPAEAEADEDWRMMDVSQIGLFMVLLNYGWSNNGLPKKPEDIWRAIPLKITLERFTELWSGLIENKFPVATDGRRRNQRQEIERQLALDVSSKRKHAANVRHRKERNDINANAEHLQREGADAPHYDCNYDSNYLLEFISSSEKEQEIPDKRSKLDVEFEDIFWPSVWLKVGKEAARKAYWKARRKHRGQLICDAAKTQGPLLIEAAKLADRTALYPATWLNEGRFQDEDFGTFPRAPVNGAKKPSKSDMVSKILEELSEEDAERERNRARN